MPKSSSFRARDRHELQIAGRSRMTKEQLVEAIEKANAAATRKRF